MSPKSRAVALLKSWWLTPLIVLVALLAFASAILFQPLVPPPLTKGLLLVLVVAVLVTLAVGVGNFIQKRWRIGSLQVGAASAAIVGVVLTGAAMAVAALFGPSEDHFADDLVIPPGLEVADPRPLDGPGGGSAPADTFQAHLLEALKKSGDNDPTVTAAVDALFELRRNAPDVLERYLAASPAWRLFEEDGDRYATRRWRLGGRWQYSRHGGRNGVGYRF